MELLDPPKDAPVGERIFCEGVSGEAMQPNQVLCVCVCVCACVRVCVRARVRACVRVCVSAQSTEERNHAMALLKIKIK